MAVIFRKVYNGVRGCITSLKSLRNLKKDYGTAGEKRLLVFSHALNEGGAPLVLFEVLRLFKKSGYDVFIVSLSSGKLMEKAESLGIRTYEIKRFFSISRNIICKMHWDKVIVNTAVMWKWVNLFPSSDTIWWIHEGNTYLSDLKDKLPRVLNPKVRVFCVSEWSKNCLMNNGIPYDPSLFYYAIEDTTGKNLLEEKKTGTFNGKRKFLMVGALCQRKCQMDFLNAIEKMDGAVKETCEFYLVGDVIQGEEAYGKLVLDKIDQLNGMIRYQKRVPHDEMDDLYQQADVIVCCSDDDPLPVVVTEAFMNSKCVILSSHCGQSKLITPYVDALTYTAGDVDALAELMEATCKDSALTREIGANARKLYDDYFSMDSFEANVYKILINK